MTTSTIKKCSRPIFTVILVLLLAASAVGQTSGSRFRGTVSFANAASPAAVIKFKVPAISVASNATIFPTTTVILEIGQDGDNTPMGGTPVFPSLPMLMFDLKQAGASVVPAFSPTTLPTGVSVLGGTREITMSKPFPAEGPGLFTLNIVHPAPPMGTNNIPASDWELDITGLPANATPAVRVNASLSGRNSGFSDLTPVGVCSSGGSGTTCPPCPKCPPDWVLDPNWRWKYKVVLKFPPIPPPPPDCPICGIWGRQLPEGFDQTLVSVTPLTQDGKFLGAGRASDINLNIGGAERVGDLVDLGTGEYVQLIQYRSGSPPTVSATAAGRSSESVLAGVNGVSPLYRTASYVLALVALGLAAALFGRGRNTARRS
jgi:hypothetical protein